MKRLNLFLMLAVLVLACHCSAAGADDETNPHVWQPRIQSVSVFKNGLGFFLRQGGVSLRDGWCHAERIPPASSRRVRRSFSCEIANSAPACEKPRPP